MIGRTWRYCCGRCGTMTDGHREGGIEYCTACGGVLGPKDEIANVRRERWKLPESPKESHMARADERAFDAFEPFDPKNVRGYYILDEQGKPVAEPDLLKWGKWMQTANRHVAQDILEGGVRVSTVFLGVDHSHAIFGRHLPILWETMIFGGPQNDYQERYTSRAEAVKGHAIALALAKNG